MVKDYSQGKIYKIECRTTGKVYVGSTTKKYLSQRLAKHVSNYKDYQKEGSKTTYSTSYELIAGEDYFISLLETYPCSSSDELRAREQHFIESLECVNKQPAYRSDEEKQQYKQQYYLENKERCNTLSKTYYLENKERCNTLSKTYYLENKEQVNGRKREYYELNKDRASELRKKYYEEHKEETLSKNKEYRSTAEAREKRKARESANREKTRNYYNAKALCECGKEVSKSNLSAHRKSRNHQI